jgi:hypothetical protein
MPCASPPRTAGCRLMSAKKSGPSSGACACGRPADDVSVYRFRSGPNRYLFHRCVCGSEWTDSRPDIDLSAPVSSEEVIDVHRRLAAFHGGLADLLGQ